MKSKSLNKIYRPPIASSGLPVALKTKMPMLKTQENFIKLRKFKGYPQKANDISLWAFLFSIIFYISIFCIFHIQPSTIINTTKFWFFISNTLILIIAADFGAFSSSKEHDIYEEYVKKTQARTASSFETHYMKIIEKRNILEQDMIKITEEKIKDVVVDEKGGAAEEVKLDIVIKEPKAFSQVNEENDHEEKKKEAKCVRSFSNKEIMVENEERKMILHRSKSENHEIEVEESELSTMSIEELNKRVEEFIQFNRQIRLQAAARNRQKFEVHHV